MGMSDIHVQKAENAILEKLDTAKDGLVFH